MALLRAVSMAQTLGLYVHVPFCQAKCHYCDFASGPGSRAEMDAYLGLVAREAAREARGPLGERIVETVFLGGGTPSVLDERQLSRLFHDVVGRFRLAPDAEISMEANPESMDEAKARVAASLGVNRISMGAQSFDAAELTRLGRVHSPARIREAFGAVRAAGIPNVNLDLICGFPGNAPAKLESSLDALIGLAPEHASVYIYQLEPDSRWGRAGIEPPDEELQVALYYLAKDRLEAAGYTHYEISNFARPLRECRHNLKYWLSEPYLGLGLSAASYLDGVRSVNPDDPAGYERAVANGRTQESALGPAERAREELMLKMRLIRGVQRLPGDLSGRDLRAVRRALERFSRFGLVNPVGEGYALSRAGLTLSNEVFAELI